MRFATIILTLELALAAAGQEIVTTSDHQFLFNQAPFLSCHASTIVELENGDLVAAYFGGSYEGCEDVCIWVSRRSKDSTEWSSPLMAADGVLNDTLRKACYNPVLQLMPNGELWLFFKIGSCVADWTGWVTTSSDGGKTWTAKEALPDGFLGPIKDKPMLLGAKLLCPSSTEKEGWRIHFEILDLENHQWHKVGPIKASTAITTIDMNKPDAQPQEIMCIQPALLRMADGSLKALCRTKNGRIAVTTSHDNGESWSQVTLTDLPNNNSGIDAVTLQDGRLVLVYNPVAVAPGDEMGPRTPLAVAISQDGECWRDFFIIEGTGEFSYPAVIQGANGKLYCTYTWQRKLIAFRELSLE